MRKYGEVRSRIFAARVSFVRTDKTRVLVVCFVVKRPAFKRREVRFESLQARGHLRRLHLLGVSAAHRVDATRLHSADARFGAAAFDDVVFTHPHLGTEDVHAHHSLLAHFFASLKQADLRVAHVTLAASQPEA